MTRKSGVSSAIQVVAVGILLLGIAIVGSSAYSEYQSSPYLVQVDDASSSAVGSATAYDDLQSSEKAIFDRIMTNPKGPVEDQAAQVKGDSLEFFANNVVQYQGNYYSFTLVHDPTSLTILSVAIGSTVTAASAILFLLTRFVYGQ